ncbi:efflux RND transporter periplasmic adaptor subunit [Defluviimonas sp. SAOS-178_SWC]|uniref:efflux RND transporter periplasmic adaptor subunit n=1 Tax=Defluviimonas sp. SAOS-178_SWC TaxID=3121287 RepID=UPI003221CF24
MRFLTRSLLGLFLLALTLALLAVGGVTLKSAFDIRNADTGPSRPAEERAFTARVVTLSPDRIAPVMTAFGEVRSRRQLELRAAAAGPIVELTPEFADGTAVEAGQLLVRIDPADAQSALDLARTGMREAEAEMRDAERALGLAHDDLAAAQVQEALRAQALERQKGIAGRGLGTAADLEAAELAMSNASQGVVSRRQALAQAEARVEKAVTALDRQGLTVADAERRLAETELRAEFSGVLSGVTAVAGGLVAKTEKLGELIDPEALEVAFRVSTAQYARLIDGGGRLKPLPVKAAVDVLGAELTARGSLARVDAAVGAGLSGRLVFATLDTARGFRPGDFVTLEIAEPPLDGVALIPARAVGSDGTLLVLGPGDRLESAPAEVLRRQGDDVIVRVGALAGREIVVERTSLLGAGILVRPVRGNGAALAEGTEHHATLVDLTPERRAALIAFVEGSGAMPEEAKSRVLAQLREERVPAEIVSRIEARMGG